MMYTHRARVGRMSDERMRERLRGRAPFDTSLARDSISAREIYLTLVSSLEKNSRVIARISLVSRNYLFRDNLHVRARSRVLS